MKRTAQQSAFITELTQGSSAIVLEAVAGSGKTTTLVEGASELPGTFEVLSLAFNKHSAVELEKRMPPFVICKTLNGLGHSAWSRYIGKKIKVNASKLGGIISDTMSAHGWDDSTIWSASLKLADQARIEGLVPEPSRDAYTKSYVPDTPEGWEQLAVSANIDVFNQQVYTIARKALITSIEQAKLGSIDFTDQLYMTVMFKAPVPQYKLVMIDEAQDLNPIQHVLVERAVERKGRIIAVGDSRQAIYAWRGACSNSLELFQDKFKAKRMPLSVCFRCAKSIVAEAQKVYTGIEPFSQQIDGIVEHVDYLPIDKFQYGDAVICRNNAPLLKLAYQLIKKRVSVKMLGRDIGAGLSALLKRVSTNKQPNNHGRDELVQRISNWATKEIEKAKQKYQNYRIESIEDKAESCKIILGELASDQHGGDALRAIKEIFDAPEGKVILSTIHRAKGMEYNTVYFYKPSLLPSSYLLRAHRELMEDMEEAEETHRDPKLIQRIEAQLNVSTELLKQESNLDYVARTRAQKKLVYIEVD